MRHDPDGKGGQIVLNYFHTNEREIERHYTLLGAVHSLILKAFDRCVDGRITADPECAQSFRAFHEIGKRLNDQYREKYGLAAEQDTPTDQSGTDLQA